MANAYKNHNISPNEFRKTRADDLRIIDKIINATSNKVNQMRTNQREQDKINMEINKRLM